MSFIIFYNYCTHCRVMNICCFYLSCLFGLILIYNYLLFGLLYQTSAFRGQKNCVFYCNSFIIQHGKWYRMYLLYVHYEGRNEKSSKIGTKIYLNGFDRSSPKQQQYRLQPEPQKQINKIILRKILGIPWGTMLETL